MAYYYDIVYDKKYSNVKYKIPYLGDLLERQGYMVIMKIIPKI